MTYYDCPVCSYDRLTKPPKDFYICPCCGTEFELDDDEQTPYELRSKWIAKDMPWFSTATPPPKDWSPYRQLIIGEHGSDLTAHHRFRTDLDYRSAVNKAFSEVRIAKQLKVLRETRDVPLTQAQLANKAEMKQSRISELEGMNYSSWSISTLERLAKALGVGFKYSFVGWGELVPEIVGGLSREALSVPSFESDPAIDEFTSDLEEVSSKSKLPPQSSDFAPYEEFLRRKQQSEVNRQQATQRQATLATAVRGL